MKERSNKSRIKCFNSIKNQTIEIFRKAFDDYGKKLGIKIKAKKSFFDFDISRTEAHIAEILSLIDSTH